ncbi:hypothetical protein F0U59_30935 [Archangium gephyra]|nr:hypothetical protein F0U59_30935 [Archangium gephyra]
MMLRPEHRASSRVPRAHLEPQAPPRVRAFDARIVGAGSDRVQLPRTKCLTPSWVTGGYAGTTTSVATAELYDPVSGRWTSINPMTPGS